MDMAGIRDESRFDRMAEQWILGRVAWRIRCPTLPRTGEFDPLPPVEDANASFGRLKGPR